MGEGGEGLGIRQSVERHVQPVLTLIIPRLLNSITLPNFSDTT